MRKGRAAFVVAYSHGAVTQIGDPKTQRIADLRRWVDAGEIEQADAGFAADQLELPLGAPLLLISRVTRDQRGRPFDYLRALYRPDRFSYHMRLNAKDLVVRGYR